MNESMNFGSDLIEAIQPIRQFVKACAIHHFFDCGLYDLLYPSKRLMRDELVLKTSCKEAQLDGFLNYLRNENLIIYVDDYVELTNASRKLHDFRSWYTMLIGGYGETFLQIGDVLNQSKQFATRNLQKVGIGSCGISHYDAIPLVRNLMTSMSRPCKNLLDLGCGNGLYLAEFCKVFPDINACGIEPSEGGYLAAKKLIQEENLEQRVKLFNCTAGKFLTMNAAFEPDLIVLGFVLHEILGQEGEEGVRNFLQQLITNFPAINIIVIEVDDKINDPLIMQHGLALAYYNPYYLLHYFTQQKLETRAYWNELFNSCGLKIIEQKTVDLNIDSTHLEIGYLLAKE